jgi:uncharacterized paraquat-inducible protein A
MRHSNYCQWCDTRNPSYRSRCSSCGRKLPVSRTSVLEFTIAAVSIVLMLRACELLNSIIR